MPKKQSTSAKKARAVQREAGGKHTALLAVQTCGKRLDPWGVYPETCARAPHPEQEPCSLDRGFDAVAWREKTAAEWEKAAADWPAEQARWEALTPDERAEAEQLAREEEHDDDFDLYEKYYGDHD